MTVVEAEPGRRIAAFIVDALEFDGPAESLLGDPPVRLTEALDSAALLELASYVEDEFGVAIADDEIVPENFATVAAVVALLGEKTGAA